LFQVEVKEMRIVARHPPKEPVVWIIDSEQWPRACLRAELIERGYDACGFVTIRDALDSLSQPASPRPQSIVLELRGQSLTDPLVEAVNELRIPIIILGGSAEVQEPLVKGRKWDCVLKRPVSLGEIADVVEKRLPRKAIDHG
jgi:FixJ family two-component response regulator